MAQILIIEDDAVIGEALRSQLAMEGFATKWVTNGRQGLKEASSGAYQLILLDLMLPLLDGMHILKRIREQKVLTPVIIVTAKTAEAEKLSGFQQGCDDYVTKPFSIIELIARIRAVLRRSGYREERNPISLEGLLIDPNQRTVTYRQTAIDLAPKEFELLYRLAMRPGQVLARDYLFEQIWGEQTDSTNRTVDTHIASLRSKLEAAQFKQYTIVACYKVGYKLIQSPSFSQPD